MLLSLIHISLLARYGQLLEGHLDAAVACEGDDGHVGASDLRADSRRQPETHRAEAPGRDPAPGLIEQVVPVSYTHLDVYKRQVVGDTGAVERPEPPKQGAAQGKKQPKGLSLIHICVAGSQPRRRGGAGDRCAGTAAG